MMNTRLNPVSSNVILGTSCMGWRLVVPEGIHGEYLAQVPGASISEFPSCHKFESSKLCSYRESHIRGGSCLKAAVLQTGTRTPDAHPEIDTWLADETTSHSATLPPLGQMRVIFYGGTTR